MFVKNNVMNICIENVIIIKYLKLNVLYKEYFLSAAYKNS